MCNTGSYFSVSYFRNRVAVWLFLAIFISSVLPSTSFAQQPTAQVKAWTGSVLVSGQAVTVGMVLYAGDTLQTGSQALAIIELSDGSTVHLGANTQVTLADLTQTATGGRVSLIKLFAGRVRALLSANHQKPGSAFTIETPNAQIGVKFSQPDVEVSYDPAKQETVGIAHTVELIAINLLTNEKILVPVGTTVIIVGILMKIAAGTAASAIAAHAATTATTTATTTGTTATTTTATSTTTGTGSGTMVAVGAGALAVAGGVAAVVANSRDGKQCPEISLPGANGTVVHAPEGSRCDIWMSSGWSLWTPEEANIALSEYVYEMFMNSMRVQPKGPKRLTFAEQAWHIQQCFQTDTLQKGTYNVRAIYKRIQTIFDIDEFILQVD